nr:hypothetical protein [Tanacetum cinerariifolium]
MDTIIDQQVAMDEALVPHAKRLRIRRSNFRLLSDIKYKESTFQLVYDATANVHHHAIRFKMDNKKHIVNLESFRDMLHVYLRVPGQYFVEPPFEEKILAFIRFLGHNAVIRKLTNVNINKLYQPWRSFAAIINKCLTGKSSGYDSLRLSQAQIMWGLYHKRNVDYAYLMWEDFVYQVEHKDLKKSNEMDDHMFSMIKSVSRHQNMQQFSALLPIKLTNEEIRNSNAYKEYNAVATGAAPPKPKAIVWKTRSSSDTTITPPTVAADEGSGSIPRVLDVPIDESKEELSWNFTDEEGDDDEGKDGDGDDDGEEGDGDDDQEVKRDDEKDDEEKGGDDEQEYDKKEYDEETRDEERKDTMKRKRNMNYTETSILIKEGQSSSVSSQFVTSMLNPTPDAGMELIFETTSQMDAQTPTSVAPLPMTTLTLTFSTIATITTTIQAPTLPTTALSTLFQDLPNFGSLFGFDNRLRTLEANFSEFMETNQFVGAVSAIPKIVHRYMDQRMNEAVQAFVKAYEFVKIILDTYGEIVTLKIRRDDDADKDEEPSDGPDRGSKRRREGKEPESVSAPTETATRSAGRSTQGTKSRQTSGSESSTAEEPM